MAEYRGQAVVLDHDPDRSATIGHVLTDDGFAVTIVDDANRAATAVGRGTDVLFAAWRWPSGDATAILQDIWARVLPCGVFLIAKRGDSEGRRAGLAFRTHGVVWSPFAEDDVRQFARVAAELAQRRRGGWWPKFDGPLPGPPPSIDDVDPGDLFLMGLETLARKIGDLAGQPMRALALRMRGFDIDEACHEMGICRSTYNKHLHEGLEAIGAEGPHDILRAIASALSRGEGNEGNDG